MNEGRGVKRKGGIAVAPFSFPSKEVEKMYLGLLVRNLVKKLMKGNSLSGTIATIAGSIGSTSAKALVNAVIKGQSTTKIGMLVASKASLLTGLLGQVVIGVAVTL